MTSAEYKQVLARALRELDTFSIPEVGTLVSESVAASIDTAAGVMVPPHTRVRFDVGTRHLKPFYDFLSERYGLKRDQAEATAADIGRQVGESLKVGAFDLSGVGRLVRGPKGVQFEATVTDPTQSTFGLRPARYPGLLPGKSLPTAESLEAAAPKAGKTTKGAKAADSRAAAPASKGKTAAKTPAAKTQAKASGKSAPAKSGARDLRADLMARTAREGREPSARELAELEIALEELGKEAAERAKPPMSIARFTLIVTAVVLTVAGGLIYLFRDAFFAPPPPPAIPLYEKQRLRQHDSLNTVAATDSLRRDSLTRRLSTDLGTDTSRRARARIDSLQIKADELSAEANDPVNATYRIIAGAYETETDAQNQLVRWRNRPGYKPEVVKGGRAGGRYKLQVFVSKNGAEARRRLDEVKAAGYPDAELRVEAPK